MLRITFKIAGAKGRNTIFLPWPSMTWEIPALDGDNMWNNNWWTTWQRISRLKKKRLLRFEICGSFRMVSAARTRSLLPPSFIETSWTPSKSTGRIQVAGCYVLYKLKTQQIVCLLDFAGVLSLQILRTFLGIGYPIIVGFISMITDQINWNHMSLIAIIFPWNLHTKDWITTSPLQPTLLCRCSNAKSTPAV